MYCESEQCVHNKDLSCSLEKNLLDTRGICYDFYSTLIPEELLDLLKERQLKRLEQLRQKNDFILSENDAPA